MSIQRFLVVTLFLLVTSSLSAQTFRSAMRSADKEYEIHAFNLAIASYEQALLKRPNDTEALSKIADSYRHLNRLQDAHRYYQQAVRQSDVQGPTVLNHANVLKGLSRYDEAKQWYLLYARDYDAVAGNHYAESCDFAKAQVSNNAGYTVNPTTINTPTDEFGPTYVGQTRVIFNSSRTDLSTGFDGQARNHPFISAISADGTLAVPYLLNNGYQDAGNVGPVSYAPDGSQVVFTRNNFVDGTRKISTSGFNLILMLADVNPSGQWVNVRPFPYNGTDYSSGFGMFSTDGATIYFASNRPGGLGGYDIYKSTRVNGSWTQPENLGAVVNSPGDETTPSHDGTNLYFSSDWHNGLGGLDVFRAEERGGRFTQIYHLGSGINSARDDHGFIFDNGRNLGYVTSNRVGGTGNEDLYRVNRAAENMTIVVRDGSTNAPLPAALVDFTACGDRVYQTDANGRYVFSAVKGLNCSVVVGKDGYNSVSIPVVTGGGQAGGEIPVSLVKISESFQGNIIDYTSRRPINGVNVQIMNQATGTSMTVQSDPSGRYLTALQPYTTYAFQVTAPGYESLSFTLGTNDGNNRDLLGTISMLPASGGTAGQQPYPPNNTGGGSGSSATAVRSGFAVQLASLSKQPAPGQYNNLADAGQIYTQQVGGAYKVRLGVFTTRAQAEAARAAAKAKGYSGAFVVTEEGANLPVPATGGGAAANPNPAPANPFPADPNAGGVNYAPFMVQLGAYSSAASFDRNKAAQLGQVEQRSRGNLTLFLIGGLRSVNEARIVQSNARQAGYTGAFVVEERGTELVKVPN